MRKTTSVRWLAAVVAGVVVGVILATSVGVPAVPAAARAASIARCDIRARIPVVSDLIGDLIYASRIRCNGSVTRVHLVLKLQRRWRSGRWHVVEQEDYGSVEVRHDHIFAARRICSNSGTFRSIGIMTRGSNSEKDVSGEVRITCP